MEDGVTSFRKAAPASPCLSLVSLQTQRVWATAERPPEIHSVPTTRYLCRALVSPHIYREAFSRILTALRQSAVSGLIAFAVNLIFAQGFFWSGQSPKDQSYGMFVATTSCYVAVFLNLSMVMGFAAPLVKYHWIWKEQAVKLSGMAWFYLMWFKTFHYFVAIAIVSAAIGYTCAQLQPSLQPFQLHFYLNGVVINGFTAAVDVTARQVFQTETVEGLRIGHVNRQSFLKRVTRTYLKDFAFVIAVFAACGYIHVSSRIRIRSQMDLLVFSFVSMAYRILIMKFSRHFILKIKKVHIRVLYVVASVPTVLINTQIRIALLNVQSDVSLAGVVILALIEPIMRIFKVWNVRREIQKRGTRSTFSWSRRTRRSEPAAPRLSIVQGNRSITVVPSQPSQVSSRVSSEKLRVKVQADEITDAERRNQWIQRLLQFTAAEIHAEMCSEYIAIACSLSIYFCLQDHPKFAWNGRDDEHGGSTAAELKSSKHWSQVKLVLLQLVIEVAVDLLCSVWELAHSLPLRTTTGINRFLVVIFTGCAVSNITMCCSIYLHDNSK